MAKVDSMKLLQQMLTPPRSGQLVFILSDEPIFFKIAKEVLSKTAQKPARLFSQKEIPDLIEYLATGDLFASTLPCIVKVEENITKKEWTEAYSELQRLPSPPEVPIYFFAPTAARTNIKEEEANTLGSLLICWSPSDAEALRMLMLLAQRFPSIAAMKSELPALVGKAFELYSGDLSEIDDHFARMEQGSLPFEGAFIGQARTGVFDVIDAIARRDPAGLEIRLQQCALNNEQASALFGGLVYFFKQVVQVQALCEDGCSTETALRQCPNIPYPSHVRIVHALKHINRDKLTSFFASAPIIEFELRNQRNPWNWLSVELHRLLE